MQYSPVCLRQPKPLYEWTQQHEQILSNILLNKYNFSNDLLLLLIKFIDKDIIPDPNEWLQYPVYIEKSINEYKLSKEWYEKNFDNNNYFAHLPGLNNNLIKITVFGEHGAGKSAITYRYLLNKVFDQYDPTIEDAYIKEDLIDDVKVRFSIFDTAGSVIHWEKVSENAKGSNICLIVYSIASRYTFNSCQQFYQRICQTVNNKLIPIILVCNKCDLIKDNPDKCQVSIDEGINLSDRLNIPLIFTSAKDKYGGNIKVLFTYATKQLWIKSVLNAWY